MTTYKNNYLTKVILRVDFARIELGNLTSFIKILSKEFPNYQKKTAIEGNVQYDMTSGNVKSDRNEFPAWRFEGENKSLEVSEKYFFIEYKKYTDSKELLHDTNEYLKKFINEFSLGTITRLGLRYTNEIPQQDDIREQTDWSLYIDTNLVSSLNFAKAAGFTLLRNLSETHFKAEENAYLVFRYGVWNYEYPNPLLKSKFILDFDCYSYIPFNAADEDITVKLRSFNNHIEKTFERSITDKFRDLLNK